MPKKAGFYTTLKRAISYAKPHKSYFILACLFDLVAVGLNTFLPVIMGWGIDYIVGPGNVNFVGLGRILILITSASISCAVFDWFAVYFSNVLSNKTSESIRNLCFEKMNKVPLKFIDNKAHGDIMNTMVSDVDNLADGFLTGIRTVLSGSVTILTCAGFMLWLKWEMALLVMTLAPLSFVLSWYINKKAHKMYIKRVNMAGEMSGYCEEMVSNLKVVKAYNTEEENINKFKGINHELAKYSEKSQFFSTLAGPCSRFINGTLYGIVGCFGAFLGIKKKITVGQISSFLSYVSNYTAPFADFADIFADIQVALASASRVFDLLDQENVPSDEGKEELVNCNGNLRLENVYFSYTPHVKLIENFNLSVKKGQHVAIVGPTGCGKSTLINLLMRFYDIEKGKIIISGKDSTEITRNSLRSCYGMVLQDSWLYNATIRDNIAYGKSDASMEEIIEASKLAGSHTFIEKLPNGYETIIEENGDNISAGQKQLLCIARIMLLKPPMLILDEATSNIDTMTEKKIQEAFAYISEGRTSFMVAHRLSTIINSDIILVMNKGNIIEQGTHQELMEKKGFYYNLFNSQFGQ